MALQAFRETLQVKRGGWMVAANLRNCINFLHPAQLSRSTDRSLKEQNPVFLSLDIDQVKALSPSQLPSHGYHLAINGLMSSPSTAENIRAVIINDRTWREGLASGGWGPDKIDRSAHGILKAIVNDPRIVPIVVLSVDRRTSLFGREASLIKQLDHLRENLDPVQRDQTQKELRIVWAVSGESVGIAAPSADDFFYGLRKDVFRDAFEDRVLAFASLPDWLAAKTISEQTEVDGLYIMPRRRGWFDPETPILLADAASHLRSDTSEFFEVRKNEYLSQAFSGTWENLVSNIKAAFGLGSSSMPFELEKIPTIGAQAHDVYRLGLGDRGHLQRFYLKNAAADVEILGDKLLGFAGFSSHRIQQVGDWQVSEAIPGRHLDDIPLSPEVVDSISLGIGKYLAAAYVFGIVERDPDARNVLFDEARHELSIFDLEVVLYFHEHDISYVGKDLANLMNNIAKGSRFKEILRNGFNAACDKLFENSSAAAELALKAQNDGIKIGFTGHEPGIGGMLTGTRRLVCSSGKVLERITSLSGAYERARVFDLIVLAAKKELRGSSVSL